MNLKNVSIVSEKVKKIIVNKILWRLQKNITASYNDHIRIIIYSTYEVIY